MKKLILKQGVELTSGMMKELLSLVEQQETTDYDPNGSKIKYLGEYGTYKYEIDEDLNVVLLSCVEK